MKWLPAFIIIVIIVSSCKDKKAQEKKIVDIPKVIESDQQEEDTTSVAYNDTVTMPWKTDMDTGYFKGYIPDKLSKLEKEDTSHLGRFLSALIDTRKIILLNKETLSHSVLIDHVIKKRYDTLKNKDCLITTIYDFNNKDTQYIKINGIPLKAVTGGQPGVFNIGDILDFDHSSFRYFSFKGKKYYYIRANYMDAFGASMGNVNCHMIYDLEHKSISCFETCRYAPMLFGDVDGDARLDYLDFINDEFCTTVPGSDSVTIQLYSCNEKGQLVLQKGNGKQPYYIAGHTGIDFQYDSFNVSKASWIKPLK
jgi:hypothetical protein